MFTVTEPQTGAIQEYQILKRALDHPNHGIIRWQSKQETCCLDVDNIVGADPETIVRIIEPAPSYAWVSRSRKGIHAIYDRLDPFNADEIAALAVLWFRSRDFHADAFELLRHTFKPPYEYHSKEVKSLNSGELDALTGKTIPDDAETRESWLRENAMEIGQRYSHDRCPYDPNTQAKRDPVIVYESGVYCHVCKTFRSFVQLSGHRISSDFGYCVRNKTHWEHARHIVGSHLSVSEELARAIYSASIIHTHGYREEGIFYPRRNLIRLGRWWATESGELYNDKITRILQSLPCVRYLIEDDSKVKIDGVKLDRLQQTTDLTELGYPSIEPIRGIKIYGHYLQSSARYSIVLQNETIGGTNVNPQHRPAYVSGNVVHDINRSWALLEEIFPGINRAYIELLIAARGCSEGQIGLPPFIYVSGSSSTAKTASIMVAAAIIGDSADTIPWKADIERNRQAILRAKGRGGFVAFDEILKAAKREGVDIAVAMDDVLTLTPNSLSHEMYIGPVPLGRLPVIIWADTDVPDEIRNSVQFGRRLVHVHQSKKVEWEKPMMNAGLHRIEQLRLLSPEIAEACNVIVSDIIDRFFQFPQDLKTIAAQLGFGTLVDEVDSASKDVLIEFYNAVMKHPEPDTKTKRRWAGDGWKVFDAYDSSSLLAQLWDALRDSGDGKTSRRLSEADWPTLLNLNHLIEFQVMSHGNKIGVRYVQR